MKNGNSNARTHGGFTKMTILPGEDPEEFETLHRSLIDEWDPQGPTQDDKVLSIAINIWRKRRHARYVQKHIEKSYKTVETYRHFDNREIDTLIKVTEDIESGKSISEQELSTRLPQRWAKFLSKHIPRKSYGTDSAWLADVADGIFHLTVKLISARDELSELNEDEYCDPNSVATELAFEERIDARIDKAIVSLGRIKTLQGMGLGRLQNGQATNDKSAKQIDPPLAPGDAATG